MRKKTTWLPIAVFFGTLAVHAWVTNLPGYIRQGFLWLGYSYALTAAFTTYAALLSLERSARGIAGAVAGASWAGLLYGVGCWAVGCCGSPLLTVYLGVLGSRLLGFEQPIVAAVTTLSVLGGFVWVKRGACRIAGVVPGSPNPAG
jgi:hypothetical protein